MTEGTNRLSAFMTDLGETRDLSAESPQFCPGFPLTCFLKGSDSFILALASYIAGNYFSHNINNRFYLPNILSKNKIKTWWTEF